MRDPGRRQRQNPPAEPWREQTRHRALRTTKLWVVHCAQWKLILQPLKHTPHGRQGRHGGNRTRSKTGLPAKMGLVAFRFRRANSSGRDYPEVAKSLRAQSPDRLA